MKSLIKGYLKKFPNFYSDLSNKKTEIYHNLPGWIKLRNFRIEIRRLLENTDPEPHYRKRGLPAGSLIEITNACNLNCVMCNTKMSARPIGFMKPGLFEKILRELGAVGIKSVSLHTVGEPFMYKDLEKLLAIVKKYDFEVMISTNGQFPKQIEKVYKQFPDIANKYRFSIDSATPGTYESIRRGGSFNKLLESLEIIHRINGGRKNSRINLAIESILSMQNMFEIPEFFKVFDKYCWPKRIFFNPVGGLPPDPGYQKKGFPFLNLIKPRIPCHLPFKHMNFTYSGKATLCCIDYDEQLVVGDIQRHSIPELWNSPRAEEIREKHAHREKMDIKPCRACFGTHEIVSKVINAYIHFLIVRSPDLSSEEFGNKLITLLHSMDATIKDTHKARFEKAVLSAFDGK
jgi:MoaA/NifB/PqqE/SkfB family radical SAM enzyme